MSLVLKYTSESITWSHLTTNHNELLKFWIMFSQLRWRYETKLQIICSWWTCITVHKICKMLLERNKSTGNINHKYCSYITKGHYKVKIKIIAILIQYLKNNNYNCCNFLTLCFALRCNKVLNVHCCICFNFLSKLL